MSTYAGNLLRIDLSSKTAKVEKIPLTYYQGFISARGLGARYLYDELGAGINPLSEENKLLLLIGVLGGTKAQGFSKWVVMSKSPLTGTIMRSFTGGNFGVWMRFAGYDLIIIEGKADKPCYVYIDERGAQFLGADEILGLDARKVQLELKKKHGAKTESACIGLAGEKLARYAVITSGERTASRGGMGAVMGSKNLKAIAINVPVRKPIPFDKAKFENMVKKQSSILKDHPRKRNMTTLGTPYITTLVDMLGILPVRNFQEGSIQNIDEISGDEFYKLKKAKTGCFMCMTRCGGMRDVGKGPLRGTQIDGPEYETIYAFGPLLGIIDRSFIIDANALCDYYGIDTISTGVSIAFACELFEKGIISTSDMDALDLSWGNKEAIFSLIEKIGKREGIGYLLGEGVKRAVEHMGGEAGSYAMHIKGLELPGYEPRGIKGYALSMATSNIGGSHMYGRPRDELSGKVDPLTEEGKGESIAQVQKEQAVDDSVISCTFGNSGLDMEFLSEYLLAATGIREFSSVANLLEIGERIICLERCFNVREGFTRKDDTLPERMLHEPLQNAGPATNQVVKKLDKLLDEYYKAFGYTKEGIPTPKTLKRLNLSMVENDISFFKE